MSGESWYTRYRLGLDFAILVGDLDRKIGYNVSREEDNESSYRMLNRDIIDGVSNVSQNVYFDTMVVPGETHAHFMKYWRELEKILCARWNRVIATTSSDTNSLGRGYQLLHRDSKYDKHGHLIVTRRLRKEREKLNKIVMEIGLAEPNRTASHEDSEDHDDHDDDGDTSDSDQRDGNSSSHVESENDTYMSDSVGSSDSEFASSNASDIRVAVDSETNERGRVAIAP